MDQILDILLTVYGPTPYLVIFGILFVCGIGVPIPEDITLFAAGLSAYYGLTKLSLIIIVSYLGVMIGDWLIFLVGQIYGDKLAQNRFFQKVFSLDRQSSVQKVFQKRGNVAIFFGRFMPGLRAPIFFFSGAHGVSTWKFLFWDGLAAFLSVPAIIGAVYYFGDELDQVVRLIQRIEHGIVFAVVGFIVIGLAVKWYLARKNKI
jgi:membrane protein DedA with SNARE-associated domain